MLRVRDWIYPLSVLVPLTLYNLVVKLQNISLLGETGWLDRLHFLRSNFFFSLGFGLFWIALLAMARRGPWRWVVLVLLQVTALGYAMVVVAAHQYFAVTGASLDYPLIALAWTSFGELKPVMASEVSLGAFAVVCAYLTFGPALLVLLAKRLHWVPGKTHSGTRNRFAALLLPVSLGAFLLALVPAASPLGISFSRDPMLHVLVTATERDSSADLMDGADGPTGPVDAVLVARSGREAKNLVLVILESTGAASVTPYNESMATTPFLDELAESSVLVERAYSTIPHTSKALVSIVCGFEPRPIRTIAEVLPGLIPSTCLPELLEPHGYRTVFFQSATEFFQSRRQLVENFGYQDFYPEESMERQGFERANYFGFEDDIMLAPSRDWLENNGHQPFFATYLTSTPHHQYLAPTRYGRVELADTENHNLYLNSVRYQDFFLENLIAQYQELGLYENTIFVIVGDHGEAFGEHHRSKHDDVLYDEVLRVPLLIHAPGSDAGPKRVAGPASLLDILPSAVELLGFEIAQAVYPGSSVFALPPDRPLFFSCFHENRCLARLVGWEKFIYYYDNQPDERFDLANDPLEGTNLSDGIDEDPRRTDVRQWRASLDETYRRHHRDQVELSAFDSRPPIQNPLEAVFRDSVALVGYDVSRTEVRRGESFRITYYFQVLEQPPPTWRLVLQARPGEDASDEEPRALAPSRLQRLYRLRYWQPGRYLADPQTVTVPEDWASSSFVITMGFFNVRREQMVRVRPRTSAEDELVTVASLSVLD